MPPKPGTHTKKGDVAGQKGKPLPKAAKPSATVPTLKNEYQRTIIDQYGLNIRPNLKESGTPTKTTASNLQDILSALRRFKESKINVMTQPTKDEKALRKNIQDRVKQYERRLEQVTTGAAGKQIAREGIFFFISQIENLLDELTKMDQRTSNDYYPFYLLPTDPMVVQANTIGVRVNELRESVGSNRGLVSEIKRFDGLYTDLQENLKDRVLSNDFLGGLVSLIEETLPQINKDIQKSKDELNNIIKRPQQLSEITDEARFVEVVESIFEDDLASISNAGQTLAGLKEKYQGAGSLRFPNQIVEQIKHIETTLNGGRRYVQKIIDRVKSIEGDPETHRENMRSFIEKLGSVLDDLKDLEKELGQTAKEILKEVCINFPQKFGDIMTVFITTCKKFAPYTPIPNGLTVVNQLKYPLREDPLREEIDEKIEEIQEYIQSLPKTMEEKCKTCISPSPLAQLLQLVNAVLAQAVNQNFSELIKSSPEEMLAELITDLESDHSEIFKRFKRSKSSQKGRISRENRNRDLQTHRKNDGGNNNENGGPPQDKGRNRLDKGIKTRREETREDVTSSPQAARKQVEAPSERVEQLRLPATPQTPLSTSTLQTPALTEANRRTSNMPIAPEAKRRFGEMANIIQQRLRDELANLQRLDPGSQYVTVEITTPSGVRVPVGAPSAGAGAAGPEGQQRETTVGNRINEIKQELEKFTNRPGNRARAPQKNLDDRMKALQRALADVTSSNEDGNSNATMKKVSKEVHSMVNSSSIKDKNNASRERALVTLVTIAVKDTLLKRDKELVKKLQRNALYSRGPSLPLVLSANKKEVQKRVQNLIDRAITEYSIIDEFRMGTIKFFTATQNWDKNEKPQPPNAFSIVDQAKNIYKRTADVIAMYQRNPDRRLYTPDEFRSMLRVDNGRTEIMEMVQIVRQSVGYSTDTEQYTLQLQAMLAAFKEYQTQYQMLLSLISETSLPGLSKPKQEKIGLYAALSKMPQHIMDRLRSIDNIIKHIQDDITSLSREGISASEKEIFTKDSDRLRILQDRYRKETEDVPTIQGYPMVMYNMMIDLFIQKYDVMYVKKKHMIISKKQHLSMIKNKATKLKMGAIGKTMRNTIEKEKRKPLMANIQKVKGRLPKAQMMKELRNKLQDKFKAQKIAYNNRLAMEQELVEQIKKQAKNPTDERQKIINTLNEMLDQNKKTHETKDYTRKFTMMPSNATFNQIMERVYNLSRNDQVAYVENAIKRISRKVNSKNAGVVQLTKRQQELIEKLKKYVKSRKATTTRKVGNKTKNLYAMHNELREQMEKQEENPTESRQRTINTLKSMIKNTATSEGITFNGIMAELNSRARMTPRERIAYLEKILQKMERVNNPLKDRVALMAKLVKRIDYERKNPDAHLNRTGSLPKTKSEKRTAVLKRVNAKNA